MNYYDEEIEINRESTKEAGPIPTSAMSVKTTRVMSPKGDTLPTEAISSGLHELDISYNNNNYKTIGTIKSDNGKNNNKNNKNIGETSESETDEDLTQNDEAQPNTYNILTSDKWKNLPIPQDLKDVMQNILKYAPQTIDTEYKLQPFIPDFVPSVGDVDAFLKVSYPDALENIRKKEIDEFMFMMGLSILDEPSGRQSDPSLLGLKLRSVFTNPGTANITTRVPTARNIKDVDKWINEMEEIHRDQSINRVNSIELNDEINIDNLMAEWPKSLEVILNENGFPSAELDCSLENYLKILSAIFDIPIKENDSAYYIKTIHVLFNLYLAINETVDFK